MGPMVVTKTYRIYLSIFIVTIFGAISCARRRKINNHLYFQYEIIKLKPRSILLSMVPRNSNAAAVGGGGGSGDDIFVCMLSLIFSYLQPGGSARIEPPPPPPHHCCEPKTKNGSVGFSFCHPKSRLVPVEGFQANRNPQRTRKLVEKNDEKNEEVGRGRPFFFLADEPKKKKKHGGFSVGGKRKYKTTEKKNSFRFSVQNIGQHNPTRAGGLCLKDNDRGI